MVDGSRGKKQRGGFLRKGGRSMVSIEGKVARACLEVSRRTVLE